MKAATLINLLLLAFLCSFSQQSSSLIYVDAAKTIGDMKPFWPFFGYDECNYTTRADGKKLLSELQALSSFPVYIRTHNLLTSKGNSTAPDLKWSFTDAYKEDANINTLYDWIVVDSIIDTY